MHHFVGEAELGLENAQGCAGRAESASAELLPHGAWNSARPSNTAGLRILVFDENGKVITIGNLGPYGGVSHLLLAVDRQLFNSDGHGTFQILEYELGRQTSVFLGHLGTVAWQDVGSPRNHYGSTRELICCRCLQRASPEVHSEEGC
jgi:hypothetical protein